MTEYIVQYAKSSRGACKKCKVKLDQGEIRVGTQTDNGDYKMSAWYHPNCFNVPRKLKGCSVEEFVQDHLNDTSEDSSILPAKQEELIEAIGSKVKVPLKKDSGGDSFISKLKADYDASNGDGKKKRKAEDSPKEESVAKKSKGYIKKDALELYGKYHKMKGDELKDYLRWNRQVLKGTKDAVLHKVIDGEMYGRLPRCSICEGGKLKFNDECTKVVCVGGFDETTRQRIPCDITYSFENSPRCHPWYTKAPTEEEEKEMIRFEEIAKGEEPEGGEEVDEKSDLGKLMKSATDIELDMSDRESMKKSVAKLVDILEESDAKLDLPDEEKKIRLAVGKILVENKDMSPSELVKLIVKQFGFAKAKAAKASKKEDAAAAKVVCKENAPLFLAFKELAGLYFGEGNRNAGGSYQKAAAAISQLPVVVTAANAKAMGKAGKTKVAGIGKGSADKMHEFVTTGTMEKLEEKRANAA